MSARVKTTVVALLAALAITPSATAEAQTRVIWAVGDGADGGSDAKSVARMIGSQRVDGLLYLGDVYENGTAVEYQSKWRPVYGAFDPIVRPTPGNHEWYNRGQGYYSYWRGVRGKAYPAYYSFRVAGWQILSLNSQAMVNRASRQNRWLRKSLRAYRGTCRIAFWHRPLLSAGRSPGTPYVEPLWAALAGRARIVLNGHEHNMQHHADQRGIAQFISGAGGHQRYFVDKSRPGLLFGDDDTYGALRLTLAPGVAHYAFVAVDGRVLHSGRLGCNPLRRVRRRR